MAKVIIRNPSSIGDVKRALRAFGIKFETKKLKSKKRRNPKRKHTRRGSGSRRRSRRSKK